MQNTNGLDPTSETLKGAVAHYQHNSGAVAHHQHNSGDVAQYHQRYLMTNVASPKGDQLQFLPYTPDSRHNLIPYATSKHQALKFSSHICFLLFLVFVYSDHPQEKSVTGTMEFLGATPKKENFHNSLKEEGN
ncbi:hypothetical protein LguiB_013541 [Lonicera macranthoides]